MISQQASLSFEGSQRKNASAISSPSTQQIATDATTLQAEEQFWSSWAVEEEQVLRECFYALQGISGERIQFPWDDEPLDNNNDAHRVERVCVRSKVVISRRTPIKTSLQR